MKEIVEVSYFLGSEEEEFGFVVPLDYFFVGDY